jgi:uncharacterized protein with HEPN domain
MGNAGRSVADLLADIETWGRRAERYLGSVSREEFALDDMRQLAVAKCIEAMGEAAGNIVKRHGAFASAHPQLQLAEAYRTRNRLSHGYDSIDWEVLWDTGTVHVPFLLVAISDVDLTQQW